VGHRRQQTSPRSPTKKDLTFDKDIKPLFDKSCVDCHGEVKPKGKLRLDTPGRNAQRQRGWERSSKPGKERQKVFWWPTLRFLGDEDDFMPPPPKEKKYPKFTAEEVGVVRAWIDQGAK